MPRDGSKTLADLTDPYLWLVCEPCGRRGRFAVARLIEQHGDARMTDLRLALAQCAKAHSHSIHEGCKARYENL